MTASSLDLRSHRPVIGRDQVDALRRRLFDEGEDEGKSDLPQVPGYELEEEIGRGSFGVVHRAVDLALGRRVALKVIEYGSPRSLLRIDREAQALARIQHPNVVQVYDKGPAGDGHYYLALEYVEGTPLDEWLRQDPRPQLPAILGVFLQIAEGLVAAHAAGLVHRDFKPANAIVGFDRRVRVLDFGLARATDGSLDISRSRSTETEGTWASADGASSCRDAEPAAPEAPCPTVAHLVPGQPPASLDDGQRCVRSGELDRRVTAKGDFVGTPFYAPPEQHQGRADARSDQFSYCVALYEAIYEERPYGLRSTDEPLEKLRAPSFALPLRRHQPPPRWLRSLLERGLQLDPEDRYPSMRSIAEELRARLQPRHGRALVLGIAAGAMGIVTAIAGTLLDEPPDPVAECMEQRLGTAPDGWSIHRDTIEDRDPAIADELEVLANHWSDAHESACRATEPSRREAIDGCLQTSRVALDHLAGWLGTADDPTWAALGAHPGLRPLAGLVDTMPSPLHCTTAPEDTHSAVLPAWQHLLDGRMLQASADLEGAAVRTDLAAAEARMAGVRSLRLAAEYQALAIEVELGRTGDVRAAIDLVIEALASGERSLAADISAYALAGSALGRHLFDLDGRPLRIEGLARELGQYRLRSDDPVEVRAWLVAMQGYASGLSGEFDDARAAFHDAAALLREADAPLHLVAALVFQEALMMSTGPDAERAPALAHEALEQRAAALGSGHPLVANAHLHLGKMLVRLDQDDAALERYATAIERFAELGRDLDLAVAHAEIAHVHFTRAERAVQRAKRALESGDDSEDHRERFRRQRDLALRSIERAQALVEPLRATGGGRLPRRADDRARIEMLSLRAYAYDPGCWDELLATSDHLDQLCRHLDGSDPSCSLGREHWRSLLAHGGAQRARERRCGPDPVQATSN